MKTKRSRPTRKSKISTVRRTIRVVEVRQNPRRKAVRRRRVVARKKCRFRARPPRRRASVVSWKIFRNGKAFALFRGKNPLPSMRRLQRRYRGQFHASQ